MSGQKIRIGNQVFDAPFQAKLTSEKLVNSKTEITFGYSNAVTPTVGVTFESVTLSNFWTPPSPIIITNIVARMAFFDASANALITGLEGTLYLFGNGVNQRPVGFNFIAPDNGINFPLNTQSQNLAIYAGNSPISFRFTTSWGVAAAAGDSLEYSLAITYVM